MNQTFGEFIREKRTEKMFRLNAFAKRVGISNVYLSYIETGKRPAPSPMILERMAGVLDLSPADTRILLSLAAGTHDKLTLPDNLGSYILERPYITETLLAAKENDTPEKDWVDFKNKIIIQ